MRAQPPQARSVAAASRQRPRRVDPARGIRCRVAFDAGGAARSAEPCAEIVRDHARSSEMPGARSTEAYSMDHASIMRRYISGERGQPAAASAGVTRHRRRSRGRPWKAHRSRGSRTHPAIGAASGVHTAASEVVHPAIGAASAVDHTAASEVVHPAIGAASAVDHTAAKGVHTPPLVHTATRPVPRRRPRRRLPFEPSRERGGGAA